MTVFSVMWPFFLVFRTAYLLSLGRGLHSIFNERRFKVHRERRKE